MRAKRIAGRRRERLLECTFLIPLVRDSDRKAHPAVAWRDLEDDLRKFQKAFSGPERWVLLKDTETVPGEYAGVKDESRKYTVAVPESHVDEFRRLIRTQCARFDQRAIYFAVAGIVEILSPHSGRDD